MKKLMLIVSAKYISSELQTLFGKITATLLPYKNKPLLSQLVETSKSNYDVRVVISDGAKSVEELVATENLECSISKLETLGSLADSVLAYDFSSYEEVLIVLGDTLIEDMDFTKYKGDVISYSHVSNSYDYTAFSTNEDGSITIQEDGLDNPKVFCGIYSISNPKMFYTTLHSEGNFYNALIDYSKNNKFTFIEEDKWIDLGHYQQLQETEIKEVESRYFNEISIDRNCGILTKKSQEKEKFINEINWYLKLPKQIEYIAPRIFEYSTSYNDPYIKMEYYGYLTLHHMYIHGNFPIKKWDEIFDVLLLTSSKLEAFKAEVDKEEINSSLKKLYYNKTIDRLTELKKDSAFDQYFKDEVNINGVKYIGLNQIIKNLESNVDNYLLNIDKFSIIHGDYFFANILYDSKSNFVRLVDPRGDFGGHGIYGDNRYDIAKLAHSVHGKYDYIVADKFTFNKDSNALNYNILVNDNTKEIETLFFDKISKIYSLSEIMFIESLLFLSMVPLHKDYPNRQHVMIMTGIEQYNKALELMKK